MEMTLQLCELLYCSRGDTVCARVTTEAYGIPKPLARLPHTREPLRGLGFLEQPALGWVGTKVGLSYCCARRSAAVARHRRFKRGAFRRLRR